MVAASGVQIEKCKKRFIDLFIEIGEEHLKTCDCRLPEEYPEIIYHRMKLQLEHHFESLQLPKSSQLFPAVEAATHPSGK